ncbi:hypothetical protein EDC01DRAFT_626569 [Geopyxis carbonaria]|nr:hypothetical protein EDC01DRAFT_626569 [Geopyxis carbonaria]
MTFAFPPDSSPAPAGEADNTIPERRFERPLTGKVAFVPLQGGATFSRRQKPYNFNDEEEEDNTETEIPESLLPMALLLRDWATSLYTNDFDFLESTDALRDLMLGANRIAMEALAASGTLDGDLSQLAENTFLNDVNTSQLAANTFRMSPLYRHRRAVTVRWMTQRLHEAGRTEDEDWTINSWLEEGRWECLMAEINDEFASDDHIPQDSDQYFGSEANSSGVVTPESGSEQ